MQSSSSSLPDFCQLLKPFEQDQNCLYLQLPGVYFFFKRQIPQSTISSHRVSFNIHSLPAQFDVYPRPRNPLQLHPVDDSQSDRTLKHGAKAPYSPSPVCRPLTQARRDFLTSAVHPPLPLQMPISSNNPQLRVNQAGELAATLIYAAQTPIVDPHTPTSDHS